MVWLTRLEPNMDISRGICERPSRRPFFATMQKVAIYTVVPLALIAMFEAVVKNLIFITLANTVITLLNVGHDLLIGEKPAASPPPSPTEVRG